MILILGGDLIGGGILIGRLSEIGGIRFRGIQSRICYHYRKKKPNFQFTFI